MLTKQGLVEKNKVKSMVTIETTKRGLKDMCKRISWLLTNSNQHLKRGDTITICHKGKKVFQFLIVKGDKKYVGKSGTINKRGLETS